MSQLLVLFWNKLLSDAKKLSPWASAYLILQSTLIILCLCSSHSFPLAIQRRAWAKKRDKIQTRLSSLCFSGEKNERAVIFKNQNSYQCHLEFIKHRGFQICDFKSTDNFFFRRWGQLGICVMAGAGDEAGQREVTGHSDSWLPLHSLRT